MFFIHCLLAIVEVPAEHWDKELWNRFYSNVQNHRTLTKLTGKYHSTGRYTENLHIFDCTFSNLQDEIIVASHANEKWLLLSRSDFYQNKPPISCIVCQFNVYPTIIYCCFSQNSNDNRFYRGLIMRFSRDQDQNGYRGTNTKLIDSTAFNNGDYGQNTCKSLFSFSDFSDVKVSGFNVTANNGYFAPSFDFSKIKSEVSYTTIERNAATIHGIIYLGGNGYQFDHCNFIKNKVLQHDIDRRYYNNDQCLIYFQLWERYQPGCKISNSYIDLGEIPKLVDSGQVNFVSVTDSQAVLSLSHLSLFRAEAKHPILSFVPIEIPEKTPMRTPMKTPTKSPTKTPTKTPTASPKRTPNSIKHKKVEPTNNFVGKYIPRGYKQFIA